MRLTNRADVVIAGPPSGWTEQVLETQNLGSGLELSGSACVVSDTVVQLNALTSSVTEQHFVSIGMQQILTATPPVNRMYLSQLDPAGIVRLGSPVKRGDILVGLEEYPDAADATHEHLLLQAIFGPSAAAVDCSASFDEADNGIVTHVQIYSPKVLRCTSCQLVRPVIGRSNPRNCPRCSTKLVREKNRQNLDDFPGVAILIEVTFRRPLQVGDLLVDGAGRKRLVARIIPDRAMPSFGQRELMTNAPVSIVVAPESLSSAPLLEAGEFSYPVGRREAGPFLGQALTTVVEKLPQLRRDKLFAGSISEMSMVDLQPQRQKGQARPEVTLALIRKLAARGLWHTARELLTIRSDTLQGRDYLYSTIFRSSAGGPLDTGRDTWVPVAARSLVIYSRVLGIRLVGVDASGHEVDLETYEPSASPITELRPLLEGDEGRATAFTQEVKPIRPFDTSTGGYSLGGLFGEDIFGPCSDYRCACRKRAKTAQRDTRCPDCNVLWTSRQARRRTLSGFKLPNAVRHPLLYEAAASLCGITKRDVPLRLPQLDTLLGECGVSENVRRIETILVSPPDLRWLGSGEQPRSRSAALNLVYGALCGISRFLEFDAAELGTPPERIVAELVGRFFGTLGDEEDEAGHRQASVSGVWGDNRRALFTKRVHFAAAAVAVPDGAVGVGEIYLPYFEALALFRSHVVAKVHASGTETRKLAQIKVDDDPSSGEVRAALVECMAAARLLVTSETAQGEFLILEGRLCSDEAFHIHPTHREALRLDFAGERLEVFLAIGQESRDELERPTLRREFFGEPVLATLTLKRLFEAAIRSERISLTPIDQLAFGFLPAEALPAEEKS